ncbi:MAG: metal-sensitive transcriptional regulator [bacterium]
MVDEKTKRDSSRRLRLIKGQIEGVERMIQNEKYCIDIINQLSAVRNALEKVSLMIMKRHIESCVAESIQLGDERQKEQKINELMETVYKFVT